MTNIAAAVFQNTSSAVLPISGGAGDAPDWASRTNTLLLR
jgi:hypothetical protein